MNIELSTAEETAPLEVIDLQVQTRPSVGKSLLSVRFLCRRDRQDNHLKMPPLSWFDASQMQRFTHDLAGAQYPDVIQTDLLDAGLRLTGSVRRITGRWTTGRTIRVEPLPTSSKPFAPFTIHASHTDLKTYAGKLYNRLWEVFTRG